jgi:hypothetical protein
VTDRAAASASLLVGARQVLTSEPRSVAHRRACGFLARQAIEGEIRSRLGDSDRQGLRWRSRFLLLEHQGDTSARNGHALWAAWSELCHFHPYDLIPDAPVINDLLVATGQWLGTTRCIAPNARSSERPVIQNLAQPIRQTKDH